MGLRRNAFEQYCDGALAFARRWPEMRLGQSLYNWLHIVNDKLCKEIAHTPIDCFYDDARVAGFLIHVEQRMRNLDSPGQS